MPLERKRRQKQLPYESLFYNFSNSLETSRNELYKIHLIRNISVYTVYQDIAKSCAQSDKVQEANGMDEVFEKGFILYKQQSTAKIIHFGAQNFSSVQLLPNTHLRVVKQ